jgi:hypothetical protein
LRNKSIRKFCSNKGEGVMHDHEITLVEC